jgi:hypothetical protein
LMSAYNHVEHTELLHIFAKLKIPAIYVWFYSGFLSGCTFHAQCGNSFSKPVCKACGVPQGTVSSPILFLIYMEDMLWIVLPTAECSHICIAVCQWSNYLEDRKQCWLSGLQHLTVCYWILDPMAHLPQYEVVAPFFLNKKDKMLFFFVYYTLAWPLAMYTSMWPSSSMPNVQELSL